jgi:predicted XRE-type DNA-binding protein
MTHYIEAKNVNQLCKTLGLPSSAATKVRARVTLVKAIVASIEAQSLTHSAAAKKAGIGRTMITAICNGNLDGISIDRLIDVADRLGLQVTVKAA